MVVKIFELIITGGNVITHIFIWAYASHLILHMLTIKGIPLLYPFKKNTCVIPGNPKFRSHTSDFKTEAMIFGFFVLLAFSLKDLFANGFWNTYNRKWKSLKALYTDTVMKTLIALILLFSCTKVEPRFSDEVLLTVTNECHCSVKFYRTDTSQYLSTTYDCEYVNILPLQIESGAYRIKAETSRGKKVNTLYTKGKYSQELNIEF